MKGNARLVWYASPHLVAYWQEVLANIDVHESVVHRHEITISNVLSICNLTSLLVQLLRLFVDVWK